MLARCINSLPKIVTSGVFLINKPYGLSSRRVLDRVRTQLPKRVKSGFMGTLDPLATGMLPICVGQATRFIEYSVMHEKSYVVTAVLGVQTETGDAEGRVVRHECVPALSVDDLRKACRSMEGESQQVPSQYSALKYQGKPCYYWARKGVVVDMPARKIQVSRCELLAYSSHSLTVRVVCSGGTYMRTLLEDIAHALGTCAYVSVLHREWVSPFVDERMYAVDQISDAMCHTTNKLLRHLPRIELEACQAKAWCHGQYIQVSGQVEGDVCCVESKGHLLGVGLIRANQL